MRIASVVLSGLVVAGAVGGLSSDRWLASGYGRATSMAMTGGDEAYWLTRRAPTAPAPTLAVAPSGNMLDPATIRSRAFEVGTRLVLSGVETLNLEIITAVATTPESGLVDGQGRPLIVVTARERHGVRLVRLLVEADRAPAAGEKSL